MSIAVLITTLSYSDTHDDRIICEHALILFEEHVYFTHAYRMFLETRAKLLLQNLRNAQKKKNTKRLMPLRFVPKNPIRILFAFIINE